jgi:hypothetical protein
MKNQTGKQKNFKKLSIEIIKSIRENDEKRLLDIAKEIEQNTGNESIQIQAELLGFIDTFLKRQSFSAEEMQERIERHSKIFARYKYHDIRARAMLLLGSHYKHTYKHFSEALEAFIEVEKFIQKHANVDKMILCESLFEKGGVYYFLQIMKNRLMLSCRHNPWVFSLKQLRSYDLDRMSMYQEIISS